MLDAMERRLLLTAYTVDPAAATNGPFTFRTIQGAINAADLDLTNDTIAITAGTYTEQLTIAKPVGTLMVMPMQGKAVTVQPPATAIAANGSRNVVTVTRSAANLPGSMVTLSGLTIAGNSTSGSAVDVGVFVGGGSTVTLQNDAISNIRDNPFDGVQTGVGVQVGQNSSGDVGTATLSGVTLAGYQKNGITVDGAGSSASITASTITGAGPTAVIAQNGIQISRGATASISGSTIRNNQYTGTAANFGTGIYLSQTTASTGGVAVAATTLAGNDFGLYNTGVANTSTTFTGNTITGTGTGIGIYSATGGTATLSGNAIDANDTGVLTDSSGATTFNNNTLGGITANTTTGLEVDRGTVTATGDRIIGSSIGLNAVSYDSNVSVLLNGSTITNASTGIAVDSTPRQFATTVNVDSMPTSTPTTVTSTLSGAHGAVITGPMSQLILAVPPTLIQASGSPALTNNASGSYNATFTFTGRDNVTSANDLVYSYQLDGGAATATTSPLTLSNLSQGTHTVKITVTDQGGLSTTTTYTITNVATVLDGGFESPVVGPGNYQYNPTGSPWSFNNAGISGNNSAFTNSNPAAPEGVQVAFLQNTSSFAQAVNFPASGNYTVSFLAAQRGNFNSAQQDFRILIDNQPVGTFQPSNTAYQSFTTATFPVTAGFHAVTFVGLDSAGGDNTAFIDNVTASVAVAAQAPTILDGGFETPVVGPGNFQISPSGTPWTFDRSGISGNNSAFTSGNPAAPEGVQVAILQTSSAFSQSVNFTTAGTYTVSFLAAQRGNAGTSRQNFQVTVDGQPVGTFQPTGTSYQLLATSAFAVAAGAHTIAFVGLNSAGGDNTAFIDNITLAVASQTTAIADGGFETPVVGAGNFQVSPSGTPWTFDRSGISGNNSGYTSGNPAAPEGVQVAFLQTDSAFSQSVNFTADGTFSVSFLAAQRGNNGTSRENFRVTVDGQSVGTFQPTGTSYQALTTASFAVTAGPHTIAFVGINSAGGDNTALIDKISLVIAS